MDTYAIGDVIEDSYGNPAVIMRLDHCGMPCTIMQVVGSDCGRLTYTPSILRRITDKAAVEWALEVARKEWRQRGLRRSQFGINQTN